jgi:NAD(P)-dependent dehydrogenase (short-subunit alcohol dehydrogenase family)
LTQDLARLEALLQVNLLAPLGLIQACAPLLGAGACVVNLSSDAAGGAFPGWGAYGLTKAALEHASATLAEEAPTWRVHWVDPGEMATDMYAEHLPGDLSHLPSPEDFAVPLLLELLTQPQASGFREALPPAQAGRTIRGPLLPSPNSSPPAPPW